MVSGNFKVFTMKLTYIANIFGLSVNVITAFFSINKTYPMAFIKNGHFAKIAIQNLPVQHFGNNGNDLARMDSMQIRIMHL